MSKKIIFVTILVLFLLSIRPFGTQAQVEATNYSTFGVSPTKLEMDVGPGKTDSAYIHVLNKSDRPITIHAYVNDFYVLPDNTFVYAKPGEFPYSSSKWITLDKTRFTIPADDLEKVKITLKVPKGIEPGAYFAAVLFEVHGKPGKKKPYIALTGRISSLILATSGPPIKLIKKGEIKSFAAFNSLGLRFRNFGSKYPQFRVRFRNDGNVYLHLKGTISIRDIFGREVGTAKISDITTYPHTNRETWGVWEHPPLLGYYTAVAKFKSYHYDYNKIETAKDTFFFVHWVVILLAVLAVALIAWRITLSRRKKQSTFL